MATLEKIRSKSVLLLVIIGAALLAFIIGDFFTSGRTLFGSGTTIAKVGDVKVDVQEFQRRAQEATTQAQNAGQRPDASMLNQQVLNQMIAEKLLEQEYEKLGLTVTDAELTETMLGRNAAYVNRYVQQTLGVPDAATAHDMAFNPSKYGLTAEQSAQLQAMWLDLEKQIEKSIMMNKYNTLFSGVLQANDLDARALYDENISTSKIAFAKKDLSTLPDTDFEVSDADIKALYNADRGRYALDEPERIVSYVMVPIVPSADDIAAAEQQVETALATLNADATAASLPSQPDFVVERSKVTASDLDRNVRLKNVVDTLAVGRATLVGKSGQDYTIAKLLGRTSETDKIKVDFIALQGGKAQTDSLLALLNAGASFDSISASPLAVQSQKDLEISMLDPQMGELATEFANAATGRWFTPDTIAGAARLFRISERTAPVTVYELATATFTVEPSNATVNNLEAGLQEFLSSVKNATEFADSARNAGFLAMPATVTASSATLSNLPDTHNAVAWTMEAKKGQVSPIFGDVQSGRFVAVALQDIYTDYTPVSDPELNTIYTARARAEKKAAKLLGDYAGKANDVAGYATLMGVAVDTTDVNFSQSMIPAIGSRESAVQGAVAAAEKGKLVGPLKSNNGVVVFQVIDVTSNGRPYVADEYVTRYNGQRGAQALGNNLPAILIGNKKVENKMTTFYK